MGCQAYRPGWRARYLVEKVGGRRVVRGHRQWATVRKIRNHSLTPIRRGYRHRCDDGDSWMLPCVFHLCMLESIFLSFCFSQWSEVCVSTQYYYFLALFSSAIFSVLHGTAFLCFSRSHFFSPALFPVCSCINLSCWLAIYVKYCGNRMFLWYIIKDRVQMADLLAFSPGKKKGEKALPLHVYFRWKLHWAEARWCSDPKYPSKPSFFSG